MSHVSNAAISSQIVATPTCVFSGVCGGSLDSLSHSGHMDGPLMVPVVSDGVVFSRVDTSGERRKESVEVLRSAVIDQLAQYCGQPRMWSAGLVQWQVDGWILTGKSRLMNWGSYLGTPMEGWTFAVVARVCLDDCQ